MMASFVLISAVAFWVWFEFHRQQRKLRLEAHRRFQRKLRRVCMKRLKRYRRTRDMIEDVRRICEALEAQRNSHLPRVPLADLICTENPV